MNAKVHASADPVAAAVAPAVTPAKTERSELKDYVAAALSVAIVGLMLYFLFIMFGGTGADKEVWERQSAILQVAVGLAGTVTGYYFGRIPAERAAATAQQSATSAQQSLVSTAAVAHQATTNENRIRSQVGELRRQVSIPLGGGAEGGDVLAFRAQMSRQLDQILS